MISGLCASCSTARTMRSRLLLLFFCSNFDSKIVMIYSSLEIVLHEWGHRIGEDSLLWNESWDIDSGIGRDDCCCCSCWASDKFCLTFKEGTGKTPSSGWVGRRAQKLAMCPTIAVEAWIAPVCGPHGFFPPIEPALDCVSRLAGPSSCLRIHGSTIEWIFRVDRPHEPVGLADRILLCISRLATKLDHVHFKTLSPIVWRQRN